MRRGIAGLAVVLVALPATVVTWPVGVASASRRGALPDLRIFVPPNRISIGLDPNSGRRELRFTHITADVGTGPFEIDPRYDPRTGTATFTQVIYRRTSAGRWVRDRSLPIAAYGVWHPPSDYQFPLTHFSLNVLNANGRVGRVVATSPKTDYCITGDTQVGGVAGTPAETFIPVSDCADPTKPLGWSVGWGDEYDQTDAGQPIDLNGVANGTYVLRATVDPDHVLTEASTANDVTDTVLRISGSTVRVLSQSLVDLKLPSVRLALPSSLRRVSGLIPLRARAAAATGSRIRSVQYLLDGQPLGPALHGRSRTYLWSTTETRPGHHYLSVRVTDVNGVMASARPVEVTVVRGPTLSVKHCSWRHGLLSLRIGGAPVGATLLARLTTRSGVRRAVFHHGLLQVRTPRPSRIRVEMRIRGRSYGSPLSFGLLDKPAVSISAPAPHMTVSGIVSLSAVASDPVGVSLVSFSLDGRPIGIVRRSPYTLKLDTRHLRSGPHELTVTALNGLGRRASSIRRLQVENPAPAMTCYVMQKNMEAFGAGSASTAPFHTVVPGETLLALVSADGPATGSQEAQVSGGGLHWRLDSRADGAAGDSEVWSAIAYKARQIGPVTASLAVPGYNVDLAIVAMEGADGTGASAHRSAESGAPSLRLTTMSAASLVFAVGNDWDRAVARRLPTGWQLLHERLDTSTGDTFWSQYTVQPTGKAGSHVAVSDLGPTTDRWNLAAVELINDGG